MKVLKFGGTSVGSPANMNRVKELITRDDETKIVVLSAVSGTTNSLVEIGASLYKKDKSDAKSKIEVLYEKYEVFLKELFSSAANLEKGKEVVDTHFGIINNMVDVTFTESEEKLLLAQGELISTQLFHYYLSEIDVDSQLLWSLNFMATDENEEPMVPFTREKLQEAIDELPKSKIYIAQGYICMNADGEVDNLKRGGSDYTASLIGAAIRANEVQIWTDIDGMHNNDPRVVDKTRPIAQLSFDEAAELAYFGAKILHPATIRPAHDEKIPVKLLNTMDPEAHGTVISEATTEGNIKALAAKDNIIAIKIKSSRMLLAYGFLRKVFEVFEKYKTSIDMITTSEIAVSLTIDDGTHLEEIQKELEQFGFIEIDRNKTIISAVGQGINDTKDIAMKVLDSLEDISIRMISFGGSRNNISMLINTEDKKRALQSMNEQLFDWN